MRPREEPTNYSYRVPSGARLSPAIIALNLHFDFIARHETHYRRYQVIAGL
jgi:hypothetical protein